MLKGLMGTSIAVLTLAGSLFAADTASSNPAGSKPWKMSGQLEEACSCDAACPCWMDSKPTRMNCAGGQVIFIDKGTYGGVSLDGLAIGMFGQSPDGETMMESIGKWPFLYMFLDEKANPEQRKALEAIAAQITPPAAPPEHTKTFWVPITRTVEGNEHKVKIGNYETFSAHLVDGGMGGPTKIVNPPGADPIHREYEQGKTTSVQYKDGERNFDWKNTNYMFANFSVDSDEQGKFVQAMMQMMSKMHEGEKK